MASGHEISANLKSESPPSTHEHDAGFEEKPYTEDVTKELEFVDGDDEEFSNLPIQLVSTNQENGTKHGHYLTLKSVWLNGKPEHFVTTDGSKDDRNAVWKYHTTLKDNKRVIILENYEWSRRPDKKKMPCVLTVIKNKKNEFILSAKNVAQIPETFESKDSEIIFYKRRRASGSALVYFESALSSQKKELLVGFDASGKPLPMESVDRFSTTFEAYFKIVHRGV